MSYIMPLSWYSMGIDPYEAPPGYFAVLKGRVATEKLGNICRACDWRPNCNGLDYRCMATPVITPDGRTIGRKDMCPVVFKRLPTNEQV